MIIEGSFTVKAPIQKLWDLLLEPETITTCLPGAEKVEKIDEKTYDCILKQKVGPIKVALKFRNYITVMNAPTHMEIEGEGEDMTKLGHFKQKTTMDLKELDGGVEVSYKTDTVIVGKLAMFGDRIMRAKAKDTEKEFTKNLQKKLESVG
jgi:uncharacterized protein